MTALRDLVERNLIQSRLAMRGAGHDPRVRKAGDSAVLPRAQQIDRPQGVDETPPALTAAAQDMKEGVDLFERNHLNDLYQRYGPQRFHKAMRTVPPEHLHRHAAHDGMPDHVRGALLAAAAVQKAFSGGDPALPDNPAGNYPDSSPKGLPTAPSRTGPHGGRNEPLDSNWHLQAPPVPRAAGFNKPGTWVLVDTPAGDQAKDGDPVGRQWVFQPCSGNPVRFPADTRPVGVGDNDDEEYARSVSGRGVAQPSAGDLVAFNGPGGSTFRSKLVMVTTGAAIGEFAGQNVAYPMSAIRGHNVGGADRQDDQDTPGGLSDRRGPRPVGVGEKSPDGHEFGPLDGASNVAKEHMGWDSMVEHLKGQGHDQESAERIAGAIAYHKYGPGMNRKVKKLLERASTRKAHDPFFGGSTRQVGLTGMRPPLENPDDGAQLTPYNSGSPYDPDATNDDPGPGNNVQSGGLTPKEYALIDRVVSHRGPLPAESAALKSLRAGEASDSHRAVLKRALRAHAFAAPGAATACRTVEGKL